MARSGKGQNNANANAKGNKGNKGNKPAPPPNRPRKKHGKRHLTQDEMAMQRAAALRRKVERKDAALASKNEEAPIIVSESTRSVIADRLARQKQQSSLKRAVAAALEDATDQVEVSEDTAEAIKTAIENNRSLDAIKVHANAVLFNADGSFPLLVQRPDGGWIIKSGSKENRKIRSVGYDTARAFALYEEERKRWELVEEGRRKRRDEVEARRLQRKQQVAKQLAAAAEHQRAMLDG